MGCARHPGAEEDTVLECDGCWREERLALVRSTLEAAATLAERLRDSYGNSCDPAWNAADFVADDIRALNPEDILNPAPPTRDELNDAAIRKHMDGDE